MRKVNYLQGGLLLASAIILNGCITLFAPRYQKATIVSGTPGAIVKLNSDSTASVDSIRPRLDKYKQLYGVTVEKDGYKTGNYCLGLPKMGPSAAIGILDAGWIVVPFMLYGDLNSAKARRFEHRQQLPELLPISYRKKNEKYLQIGKINIDSTGLGTRTFNSLKYYQKYIAERLPEEDNFEFEEESYSLENSTFSYAVYQSLKRMNYIDTEHNAVGNAGGSFTLNAHVKRISFCHVLSRYSGPMDKTKVVKNQAFSVRSVVQWKICDYNDEVLDSVVTEETSDLFVYNPVENNSSAGKCLDKALNDNLEYALIEVQRHLESKNLLTGGEKKDTTAEIEIPVPAATTNIADVKNAAVMIKVGDYLGSGAVLTADGYIVTSYSLIKDADKITVVFNDSSKVDAKLVRRSGLTDMALLKVEKTGLHPIAFSQDTDPEIGADATVVGGSRSQEMGIGLSKGILSGVRKSGSVRILQTDASLNPASIGAPLVNQDRKVLGIVSDKLMGHGVEGIGFAVLSTDVFSSLRLKYKK